MEPLEHQSHRTSKSPQFTTTFLSFRARLDDPPRLTHKLTPMHIHFSIRCLRRTHSPTDSTPLSLHTGRFQEQERIFQVQMTRRRRRMRKRRLLPRGGRGLSQYLKLIRNILKVRSCCWYLNSNSAVFFLHCWYKIIYLISGIYSECDPFIYSWTQGIIK